MTHETKSQCNNLTHPLEPTPTHNSATSHNHNPRLSTPFTQTHHLTSSPGIRAAGNSSTKYNCSRTMMYIGECKNYCIRLTRRTSRVCHGHPARPTSFRSKRLPPPYPFHYSTRNTCPERRADGCPDMRSPAGCRYPHRTVFGAGYPSRRAWLASRNARLASRHV